ncbi:hypothetical protein AVEN_90405-1 [Araneus ventricosus]|uniref:Uncharacterized protein n=1 Tax=Araneus ventricosus TaxID=182803 RepID=A0A4Y2GM53_ARAVE|nr:hypothetical protein AVEN_90405-1 [Araneus ventricosus]
MVNRTTKVWTQRAYINLLHEASVAQSAVNRKFRICGYYDREIIELLLIEEKDDYEEEENEEEDSTCLARKHADSAPAKAMRLTREGATKQPTQHKCTQGTADY